MAWYNKLDDIRFFLAIDALYRVRLCLLAELVGQLPANTFDEFNGCVKQIQPWQTTMDQDRQNKKQVERIKQEIMAELGVQGQLLKDGENQAAAGFPHRHPILKIKVNFPSATLTCQ